MVLSIIRYCLEKWPGLIFKAKGLNMLKLKAKINNIEGERKRAFFSRLYFLGWQLLPLIILYILANTILRNVYLFGWLAAIRWHIWVPLTYIMVLVVLLTIFNQKRLAIMLTLGNIAGVLFGHFLGEFLRNRNIQQLVQQATANLPPEESAYLLANYDFWEFFGLVTADLPAWEVHQALSSQGAFIWLATIIIALAVGLMLQRVAARKLAATTSEGGLLEDAAPEKEPQQE